MKDIKEFTHINPPNNSWEELKDRLEIIVDSSGLSLGAITVAELMSEICFDKADHLRANWQDEAGAEIWEKAAVIFEKTAYSLRNLIR